MGASVSHALSVPPPPPMVLDQDGGGAGAPVGLQQVPAMAEKDSSQESGESGKLPCPVKYEEIHREAFYALKPDYFEGFRFDFTKSLNQKFALTHSVYMGSVEVPSQPQCIKVPAGTYEFGANVLDPKMMLVGRILTDGRMSARLKYDVNDFLSCKVNGLLTNEPHFSQAVCDIDMKGSTFQGQLKLGNNAFYGANYIQSVTPHLALGGEAFWIGRQRKWGYAVAARHATDKAFSVAQVASTGGVSLTYAQKVSDKVSLATEFMFNHQSRECSASVGYDCLLRQCRLRGRIDTNGVVSAFLEERMNVGVTLVLSAEIDHWKKDYRFGFGMIVGE